MIMVCKIWVHSTTSCWDCFMGYLLVVFLLIYIVMGFLVSWLQYCHVSETHHHSSIFKLAFGFITGMCWTCLGWSLNALWYIFSSTSIIFIQQWSQNLKVDFSFLLCISGTRCRYDGRVPPTLHDYIPLDEELIPPSAVDLGELWNYNDQWQKIYLNFLPMLQFKI